MKKEPIKILIADDHPMMREALRSSLQDEADLVVMWEAANGFDAVSLAEEHKPDLILMDLLMPELDGLGAVRQIIEKNPQARIMVVTSLEDEEKVIAAIHAGALGYFPKTAPRSFLLEGIRRVADGVPYLPAGITKKLFTGLRKLSTGTIEVPAAEEPLTGRQEEILTLLGEGLSDAVIGNRLHLSEATVRSHVHSILQRLGLETRSQAVAFYNKRNKT